MRRDILTFVVVAAALLAVSLIAAAMITPITATDPDTNADRAITVDATGGDDAPPDQAVIEMAASVQGDEPGQVREDLATQAATIRENLADAGVNESAIETSNYRIRDPPRRHPDEQERAPYEGIHAFEITLDNPDDAGTVIDAATDANAEIGNVEFTLSETRRDTLRDEAIENAMADARTQADTIAANSGLSVTSVATVDAAQQEYRPVQYEAAAASSDDAATSIDTGDVSVTYRVEVTYNATEA